MPRNITIHFSDGSIHQYNNAPDSVTPDQIEQRAKKDYPSKTITKIDGGVKLNDLPTPITSFNYTYEKHDILHVKKQGDYIIALKRISGYKKMPDLFTIHSYNLKNSTGVNPAPEYGRIDFDQDMDGNNAYSKAKGQFQKQFIPGNEYELVPGSSRYLTFAALSKL